MTADRYALDDAAYVLGALSPSERQAFERHLLDCPACRESVQRLAGMPGLLAGTDPTALLTDAEPDPKDRTQPWADATVSAEPERSIPSATGGAEIGPPSTLLPALLAQTRREQRRRRGTAVAALSAAAACVLVLAAIALWPANRSTDLAGPLPSSSPTSEPTRVTNVPVGAVSGPQAMRPVVPGQMRASVQLTHTAWGTRIDVHCHYKQDAGAGGYVASPYVLVVTDRSGNRQQAGAWQGTPGRSASVQTATSLKPNQIAALEIDSSTGNPVLRLKR